VNHAWLNNRPPSENPWANHQWTIDPPSTREVWYDDLLYQL